MQEIDLYKLAQSVIGELFPDVEGRRQTISLRGTSQSIVGDKASLIILMKNLILNACKYSPEGASITVSVDREELGIWLGVKDDGPGIPLTEIKHVFDRFRRVGGDRHNSSVDGCGLGLSISKHIASLHHANVVLRNNDDGPGLTVNVFFPADMSRAAGRWGY
jgi:two-component system sensor histidine kinase QseC